MRRPGRIYDFVRYTETEDVAALGMLISWPLIAIFAIATVFIGPTHEGDMDLVRLAYSAVAPAFPELSICTL